MLKPSTEILHPTSVRFFGFTQILLLVAIVAAIYFQWRRTKERKKDQGLTLDSIYIRDSIKRTPTTAQTAASDAPQAGAKPLEVESALPTWDANTPPYEILGVPPGSDPDTVEAAYKKLLKRYHPDRFASLDKGGKGYQNRAHHVVLLIQQARDKMQGKKS